MDDDDTANVIKTNDGSIPVQVEKVSNLPDTRSTSLHSFLLEQIDSQTKRVSAAAWIILMIISMILMIISMILMIISLTWIIFMSNAKNALKLQNLQLTFT